MVTLTIHRTDIDHAKKACAEYNVEVYFSEHTENENQALMIIPNDIPQHELWYLARNFQLTLCEERFKYLFK